MKLVPLYNKVIVEILEDEEDNVTKSGIILVEKKEPFYRGRVTGVGCGHYQNAKRIEMDVKEGDIIVFLKNSGFAIELDSVGNSKKVVLADTDIYAKEVED